MGPQEMARTLREELEQALADLGGASSEPRVAAVHPPPELSADTAFRITVHEAGRSLECELSTNLATGYLADEEAAVDEWRRWVQALWNRLSP